ncbi:Uncharacterised protein [uncultured archaeon]|nr:Uncharacterised protein [uncultured archaeon]
MIRKEMNSDRKAAIIVGVLYIIGTVAGVLSVIVSWGILDAPDYLNIVALNASRAQLTALLILVMGLSLAMIPAMMFPILKRKNEALAVGYVIFRGALETFSYIASAICWLLLVVVARQYVDSGAVITSQSGSLGILLVKAIDPTISALLSIVFSLGALMLYYLMYQARLIPRWISGWGIIAAVVYLAGGLIAMLGSTLDILYLQMLPQEMVMAIWLIVKGFDPSAIASLSAKTDTNEVK